MTHILYFLLTWLALLMSQGNKKGMICFPAGSYQIGKNESWPTEGPAHTTYLKAWCLDSHLVTVAQFREFVKNTGHQTEAEKFGNSGVFQFDKGEWQMVDSANWKNPAGPKSEPAKDNHPVTQVSWNDAKAYCKWLGKRLPTEFEWEAAARYKNGGLKYSWGLHYAGKANIWNGSFPDINTKEDGFLTTSPVGYFGNSISGLTDMGGNVWQWCEDEYLPYPGYQGHWETEAGAKAMRGGSFLCDSTVCHGFRVTARSYSTPETSLMHVGFRCACDQE
jgi:sulfatase modifying factor 1